MEQKGLTVLMVAINGLPCLFICVEENHIVRQEAVEVINYLKNTLKMKVALITGDNEMSAQKVAGFLGIEEISANASPLDKK